MVTEPFGCCTESVDPATRAYRLAQIPFHINLRGLPFRRRRASQRQSDQRMTTGTQFESREVIASMATDWVKATVPGGIPGASGTERDRLVVPTRT